jgi:hypothetical protein
MLQANAWFWFDRNIAMQNRFLKKQDIVSDTANRIKKLWSGLSMSVFQFPNIDSKLVCGLWVSIQLLAVVEQGRGAAGANILANGFDDLLRSERFAENAFGEFFPLFADDVALRAQLTAKLSQGGSGVTVTGVNSLNSEVWEGIWHQSGPRNASIGG